MFFRFIFKLLFLSLFCYIAFYIIYIQSEKYESSSIVMIKDLSKEQSPSSLGSLLLSSGSEGMKDSKLLEVYIKSHEMYAKLEKEFNLTAYYSSNKIDIFHRLIDKKSLPWIDVNKNNLLTKYRDDLMLIYDEPSSTLSIGFAHVDPVLAQKIVFKIVENAGVVLNEFEKENTKIVLKFLKEQEKEKYASFIFSLENLLKYQSIHNTIDPKVEIESKSGILASLEAELVQKEVTYNSKLQYLNATSAEMKLLKGNLSYIRKSIEKVKRQITGTGNKQKLNVNLSDFGLLQSEVEFNKELYRQILIKLEETKISIRQNSKNLIIVSKAELPDSYSYPNKIKDIISIFIIMLFAYGILGLIFTLINEHKD